MTMLEQVETYGKMQVNRLQALKEKPDQKTYNVFYNCCGFIDRKQVLASCKADARKLAQVTRITKIELA